jgi:hypothetical protein
LHQEPTVPPNLDGTETRFRRRGDFEFVLVMFTGSDTVMSG